MIGILVLAIIITVFAILSVVAHFVCRWTFSTRSKKQAYVVTPTKDQLGEFNVAAQHSTSEPIGVQPNLSELKTGAFTLPPPWAVCHDLAFSSESPDVCQTPVPGQHIPERQGRQKTN